LLAHLLQSRSLRPHVFARHYDIGPFVVEHVCLERSVVVQLEPRAGGDDARQEARRWLLQELGYTVLTVKRYDLTARPMHVLEQVRAVLKAHT
jgi:very-short-patch-repair endonuclease